MHTTKMQAGSTFPSLALRDESGAVRELSKPTGECDWMMVVVYRGLAQALQRARTGPRHPARVRWRA